MFRGFSAFTAGMFSLSFFVVFPPRGTHICSSFFMDSPRKAVFRRWRGKTYVFLFFYGFHCCILTHPPQGQRREMPPTYSKTLRKRETNLIFRVLCSPGGGKHMLHPFWCFFSAPGEGKSKCFEVFPSSQ